MQGIGIDIVEMSRIKKIGNLSRFLEFVFSSSEIREAGSRKDKYAFIASRFAAKEAVIKALPEKISAKDFEIIKNGAKPIVHFLNKRFKKYKVLVSLSHSEDYSAGLAVVL